MYKVDDKPQIPSLVARRSLWLDGRFNDDEQQDVYDVFLQLMHACEGVDSTAAKQFDVIAYYRNNEMNSCRYSTPFWLACGGLQLCTTRCRKCDNVYSQYEVWDSVSMAVPTTASNIEQLLINHFGWEYLSAKDDRCSRCKQVQCRDKKMQVVRWPRVLIIHLKRWEVLSVVPFEKKKNHTAVAYETLLNVGSSHPVYHLRGVVVHVGEADSGHYTAFVRTHLNYWYFCDDSQSPQLVSVTRVLEAAGSRRQDNAAAESRVQGEAYMLIYEQDA